MPIIDRVLASVLAVAPDATLYASEPGHHFFAMPCPCGVTTYVHHRMLLAGHFKGCCSCYPGPVTDEAWDLAARSARLIGGTRSPYEAAHLVMRRLFGPARFYPCSCGRQADQWAYSNHSPDETLEIIVTPRWRGVRRFSRCPSDYTPLCFACHRVADSAWRSANVLRRLHGALMAQGGAK